jgi:hypothetical protein
MALFQGNLNLLPHTLAVIGMQILAVRDAVLNEIFIDGVPC